MAKADRAVSIDDPGGNLVRGFGMRVGREGTGPGDVAMAHCVQSVAAFGKVPARAGVNFAEGEVIGGDVLVSTRESFFGDGELVHERKAEIVLFGGEVYLEESARELLGGFPADLAAKAGFIAGGADWPQVAEEEIENGFQKIPIFGTSGEEGS